MSLQILQERLIALQNTTKQIEELISRLTDFKFHPGSIPLDTEHEDITTELSNEIHQTLKEQVEDLELLEQEVQDLPSGRSGSGRERDKAELRLRVARANQELKLAHTSFRKAQLIAKKNFDAAQRIERTLLLSALTDPSSSTESLPVIRRKNLASSTELSKDEKTVNASSDVTAALRRTHQLMQSELSRSQFAHDTLKESTAALSQLSEQYSTLDTLLSSSRNLLGTLLKSQKSDTWYLETAFYILVITIVWLIFRRFLYGPIWWLVWFPLKMFYKAWMGVFTALGLRSSRHGVFTEDAVVGSTEIPERPTLIIHSTAAGTLSRPSGSVRAPSINVGGGGRGAPPRETDLVGHKDIVEEVGRIIDDSHQQGSSSPREQQPGSEQAEQAEQAKPHQPNPKKRMWEEPVEAAKEEETKKDEL